MALVLMSKRELKRIEVLARLGEGRIDAATAAQLMRVSERQVFRLLKKFRDGGAASLAHRHRGRRSNHRLSDALKEVPLQISARLKSRLQSGHTYPARSSNC